MTEGPLPFNAPQHPSPHPTTTAAALHPYNSCKGTLTPGHLKEHDGVPIEICILLDPL